MFFRVDYTTCMRICGVRTPESHRYVWRDPLGNRQFECINKKKVLVPFSSAAHACKIFNLHPILVDPEPDWIPVSLSPSSSSSSSLASPPSHQRPPEASSSTNSSRERKKFSPRAAIPVVVLLGHINHGKTTLLDRIAGTLVAPFEAGGITQNISGVTVTLPPSSASTAASPGSDNLENQVYSEERESQEEEGEEERKLTFIDTPGHETFYAMRGRASACADIACIVIDVTEGRRVQTEEVLLLADEFHLPIVIAINKIDKVLSPDSTAPKLDSRSSSSSSSFTAASPTSSSFSLLSSEGFRDGWKSTEATRRGDETEERDTAETDLREESNNKGGCVRDDEEKKKNPRENREEDIFYHDDIQLVKMELRRQYQKLREKGLIKRDLGQEIMNAVSISALYGYGIEVQRQTRRLFSLIHPCMQTETDLQRLSV